MARSHIVARRRAFYGTAIRACKHLGKCGARQPNRCRSAARLGEQPIHAVCVVRLGEEQDKAGFVAKHGVIRVIEKPRAVNMRAPRRDVAQHVGVIRHVVQQVYSFAHIVNSGSSIKYVLVTAAHVSLVVGAIDASLDRLLVHLKNGHARDAEDVK